MREQLERVHRRAQILYAVRVDRIESIQEFPPSDSGAQPVFVALPDHPPLLPWNGGEILLFIGKNWTPKGHVQIFDRQIAKRGFMPELKKSNPCLTRERLGLHQESVSGLVIIGADPPIDCQRQ